MIKNLQLKRSLIFIKKFYLFQQDLLDDSISFRNRKVFSTRQLNYWVLLLDGSIVLQTKNACWIFQICWLRVCTSLNQYSSKKIYEYIKTGKKAHRNKCSFVNFPDKKKIIIWILIFIFHSFSQIYDSSFPMQSLIYCWINFFRLANWKNSI